MSLHKLLTASLVFAIVLAASPAMNPASAQSSATGSCTSTDYVAPVLVLSNSLSSLDYTKPDTVGNALVSLITLRNQYEDLAPAAGCESMKPVLIQFLALRVDVIYAQLAAKTDTANVNDYKDVVTTGATRFQATGKILNDTVTTLSFPEKMPTELTGEAAAAPQACSDAAFITQIQAVGATMPVMKGINITPLIKARYQLEDLQAPIGCGDAQSLVIQMVTNGEDQGALAVMAQADAANAATYTKLSSECAARATAIQELVLIAIPSANGPATPVSKS
jgi:hypothetical protein